MIANSPASAPRARRRQVRRSSPPRRSFEARGHGLGHVDRRRRMVNEDGAGFRPCVAPSSAKWPPPGRRRTTTEWEHVAGDGNFFCVLNRRHAVLVSEIILRGISIEAGYVISIKSKRSHPGP